MTQQDSLTVTPHTGADSISQQAVRRHDGPMTPREIIETLPATATPWQQDSVLRANYAYQVTNLHDPAHLLRTPQTEAFVSEGSSFDMPLYHSKSLIQPDSVYRPEQIPDRPGVTGEPVPYNLANDDFITSTLLVCFILAAVSIAQSGNFIQRQIKNFFHTPREGVTVITETSNEIRFQFFLLLQTALLLSLIFLFYTKSFIGDTFTVPQYVVTGIYTGIITGYFVLKFVLYGLVNWVFFDKKKNEQWTKSELFLLGIEGVVLYPIVLLLAYFNVSIEATMIYTLSVIIIAKLLTFYKTHLIFFRKNTAILQSFLYFCALEIMPLITLWGALMLTDNYLKVIF